MEMLPSGMERNEETTDARESAFTPLGLDPRLLQALSSLGYEEPTPVQKEAIPPLLEGRDLLAQAATGTGKTAAFALPLLHRMVAGERTGTAPSALILVPTRELAMQVAEAVHRYGRGLGVTSLAVYGGAPFDQQLRVLRRGVDVVVATPGRALDHLRRGTLQLAELRTVVLDEADEMLDMGFAEDLEAILDATPAQRQTALFSATMPPRVASLTERYLDDPVRVTIAREVQVEGEAPRVRQVAYIVNRAHKMAALGRILDVEQPASAMVFCRTRNEVDALTETLSGRGYRAVALHGGMSQDQRDRVMKGFRAGSTDLLVATDVAARGLDVQHVSHVVNYDVPSAAESYVHRIGRTGRAGRTGEAILFVAPRERHLLRAIERATGQPIETMPLPSADDVNDQRLQRFKQRISAILAEADDLQLYRSLIEAYEGEHGVSATEIAAALARMVQGDTPLLLSPDAQPPQGHDPRTRGNNDRPGRGGADTFGAQAGQRTRRERPEGRERRSAGPAPDANMARFRVEVGHVHGVRPGNIVGAIANEAGMGSDAIGRIDIRHDYSLVDLPATLPEPALEHLRNVWVSGQRLRIRPWLEQGPSPSTRAKPERRKASLRKPPRGR